jgi:hypothetical protein
MKLVTEYPEQAMQFERLAAAETDFTLKTELENQAVADHKLAARRAEQLGLPAPKPQNSKPQLATFPHSSGAGPLSVL